ncbi:Rossmann-like domain-containing protein [Anaerovorax odorimutans]|uniref:Rossmann-like domain-containing protein n=1 Tax=Anaerovorax odorimutans TaxID=109327 RepID=UPI0004069517|nr:DUF364 domain-containing protein [Anaerovorax odorimutans]
MILNNIFELGKSELQGKKIKDAVIGLSIISVQLDNGDIGSSYVLREELDSCCSIFPKNFDLIGMDAIDIAKWALNEKNILKRALGIATLNAGSRNNYNNTRNLESVDFIKEVKETDVVGMIGHLGPIINALNGKTKDFIIFDKGKNEDGVLSQDLQSELLPTCDVVFISGTTFINNTIDEVLERCNNAREVILVGSSTLVYPKAYKDSKISILAGSLWKKEYKDDIFRIISLAGGIKNLSQYMEKVSIRV